MQCPDEKTPLLVHICEGRTGWKCSDCRGVWLPELFIDALISDYPRHFKLHLDEIKELI